MIDYRPFLNTDPPLLADVWRAQPPIRGLTQSISASVFEKHIFSKPYFEREGFIVAEEDGRCVGFVHAGFGPTENQQSLSTDVGVVSRVMVVAHEHREQIAAELLQKAESFLKERNAKRFIAGGYSPNNPFYLGLYGGSRLPGILKEEQFLLQLFEQHGYQQVGEQIILQCRLAAFRPPINRQQMSVRRKYQIMAIIDPIPDNWWDACTLGLTDRTKFLLVDRKDGESHGYVTFWDMEPLASSWGVHAMGLYDLFVEPAFRRQGLATFLIGEALRQLQSQGITLAEFQTRSDDNAALELFDGLGFERIDAGLVLEKTVD